MEELKFVENKRINKEVVKLIEKLKEEIISNFHPKAIIIDGSFGKGEATVVEEEGELKFLSDCEIILIENIFRIRRGKTKQFSRDFYERTGLKPEIGGVILSFYLQIPFLCRRLKPTIRYYELKHASKVIYGKNYLGRILNFKPGEIPLWEGIRLLFNRMAEALEYFSLEKPSEGMVYWTDKIVLACQDALLLCLGTYNPSYRVRNKIFQELFPKNFDTLSGELPNLLELTMEATERKLNGTMNVDNPLQYWFDTTKICDKVFRYVIKKDTGIEFKDYLEFQERYIKLMNTRQRYYPGSSLILLHQNLMNVAKMLVVFHKLPLPKTMSKCSMPWTHVIYSIIPLVYFGLPQAGHINKKYLTQAMNISSLFGGESVDYNDSRECWQYVKKQVVEYWRQVCG